MPTTERKTSKEKVEHDIRPLSPATGEERERMMKRAEEIVTAENFGAREFDEFVEGMIRLLGGKEDVAAGNLWTEPESHLVDLITNTDIKFDIGRKGGNGISIRSPFCYQMLWYQLPGCTDRRPEIISTAFFPRLPEITMRYDSFLTGDQRSITQEPIFSSNSEKIGLTDQQAQQACARLHSVFIQTKS